MLSEEKQLRLCHEWRMLYLVYHKHKNQQHLAVWWRHLNMVVRGVRKLLFLVEKAKGAKRQQLRDRISSETARLGSHLVKRVFPWAFRQFHGIIALGQFIGLGFALVASLLALATLVSEIDGVHQVAIVQEKKPKIEADDDLGELVLPLAPATLSGPAPEYSFTERPEITEIKPEKDKRNKPEKKEKKERKEKKEKKKQKKPKSAMDDIFGI